MCTLPYIMANMPLQTVRALRGQYAIAKHCVFKETRLSRYSERRYSSALYISGRHASDTFSFLTPYLDIDNKLRDIEKLQKELDLRGLSVNAKELKKAWDFYKSTHQMKNNLEEKISEFKAEIQKLSEKQARTAEDQQKLTKLSMQLHLIKEDWKVVRDSVWDLDEQVIEKLVKLPNELDERTPKRSPKILRQVGTRKDSMEKTQRSHVEIGRDLGILEYRNPMQCYLCNEGALFELGVLGYAGSIFNQDNMIRVAGSDFGRSMLVEGSGLSHESLTDAFLIANHSDSDPKSRNRMHLVGGASLISFLAMHTKQLINPKHFPLRYFATGRQYTPFPENSAPMGLFNVCQSSAVHTFIIVKKSNSQEYETQFEALLDTVCKLYDNISDHYQVVMRPATELRSWEKLRISFELWSPFMKQYIEVGHVSICGDYFSKRLLIAYKTPENRDYPFIISGTVLSVPRLLGCLLEHDPDKFFIPPKVAEYMPIDS